jgi:uroporphyrinogen III methyltransferase/synthase
MIAPSQPSAAKVYLVGAGPGDPELITLRGVACLRRADVVLYDYLVNAAALEHARRGAELVPLGRKGTGRSLTPVEITDLMVAAARAGRTVVRLKGGDPSIFGRCADETGVLRAAGVPFEIVPGITTGLAVAAYCEIPITQQDDASAVAFVTGRERDAKEASCLDWKALAAFPGTLLLYMGVKRSGLWSRALIEHGKRPDTPVAVVRWCSRSGQEIVRCTLATVADEVERRGLRPPAIFVVGDVVDRAPERSWFASLPLFGRRVLVPGSPATSRKLRERLTRLGAEVVLQPAIRVGSACDPTSLDAALARVDAYDWLVFSSAHGVDALLDRMRARGEDARRLHGVRLAAIGTATADRLAHHHLVPDLVPRAFVAEALAAALLNGGGAHRLLLVRADRGREALGTALEAGGARVDQVVAYETTDVTEADPEVSAALAAGEIDWITVTSGGTARALARLYGDALSSARFASIGPIASAALRDLGHEPAAEAAPHTTAALVRAILQGEQAAV